MFEEFKEEKKQLPIHYLCKKKALKIIKFVFVGAVNYSQVVAFPG
jgi:hypothetical protein